MNLSTLPASYASRDAKPASKQVAPPPSDPDATSARKSPIGPLVPTKVPSDSIPSASQLSYNPGEIPPVSIIVQTRKKKAVKNYAVDPEELRSALLKALKEMKEKERRPTMCQQQGRRPMVTELRRFAVGV